jgi:hypothetical protein
MGKKFELCTERQTDWPCGPNGEIYCACIHSDVSDVAVIEVAKKIVDVAAPQKHSTAHGGHYYSFVTREYLFNLLLFHYQEHGFFPSGSICIVEKWLWEGHRVKQEKSWLTYWSWKGDRSRYASDPPAYWIRIPSVESLGVVLP